MIIIRKSEDRSYLKHGWLKSYRSFAVDEASNAEQVRYSVLNGLDDQVIQGGMGFGMESHHDVEIVTYILSGELHYHDNVGNKCAAIKGDVYRVSTGTGMRHSRYNLSDSPVHLLQLWIDPSHHNLPTNFEKKHFPIEIKEGQWCLIVSPYGRQGAVDINQDVDIYTCILSPAASIEMKVSQNRLNYLHVVKGSTFCNGSMLEAGDALNIQDESPVHINSDAGAELLWLDLPLT